MNKDILGMPEPQTPTTAEQLRDVLSLMWQRQTALANAYNEMAGQLSALLEQAAELMHGHDGGSGGSLQQVLDAIAALSGRVRRLEATFRQQ